MHAFAFLTTKDNWTGESAMVEGEVFAGIPKWEQDGYKIELRNRKVFDGETPHFICYDIFVDGKDSDYQVGKLDGEDMWSAMSREGEMERQASDTDAMGHGHVAAAAKLLFNVL